LVSLRHHLVLVNRTIDALVIGAGPAGSATAIRLCRRGRRVLLVDRAAFPRDKACGEGILPTGVAAIHELGLGDAFDALEPVPIRGIDFVSATSRARGDLAATGAGIDRLRLDSMLVNAAREAGADMLRDEVVRFERDEDELVRRAVLRDGSVVECGVVIAADGARSPTRRTLGIEVLRANSRHGLCARVETRDSAGDRVEVHVLGADGELYVGPTGARQLSVTWLTTQDVLRRSHAPAIERLRETISHCPSVAERIRDGRWVGAVRSAGPFPQRATSVGRHRVLLVGDAYQSIDPIGGDGITLALVGSEACASAASAILEGALLDEVYADYARTLEAASTRRRQFAALLGAAARHTRAARAVVRALAPAPWLTSLLCAFHERGIGAFAATGRDAGAR
jgi:flavin-dependent dehydrogenase